jgi:hypothetical protein
MKDLTEDEVKKIINRKIDQVYPKMVLDCKRICGYNYTTYGDDLLAFTLEKFICDKPLEYQYKIAIIDNSLPNYIGKAMALNIKSKTSPFWYAYRQHSYNSRGVYEAEFENVKYKPIEQQITNTNESFDIEPQYTSINECMMWALEQIHWYNRKLIEEYHFNKLTYKELHLKYNITLESLKRDIQEGYKEIRKLCSRL